MQHSELNARGEWIDRFAIVLSGLCLVHCVLSIFVVALIASIGGLLVNPLVHEIGLGIAIPLGMLAFWRGLRAHGRLEPAMIGGSGLCLMAYALSLPHGVAGEVGFTVIGVSLVALGHTLNRRAFAAAE
jgi:hypothetical protein